jgi:hypothetical protein
MTGGIRSTDGLASFTHLFFDAKGWRRILRERKEEHCYLKTNNRILTE